MKKIISTLLVCVLLIGCVMTFASCNLLGGFLLEGEYYCEDNGVTYEFDDKKYEKELGPVTVHEGTFEVKDGEISFTYSLVGGLSNTETLSFERGMGWIEIDGKRYEKVDD